MGSAFFSHKPHLIPRQKAQPAAAPNANATTVPAEKTKLASLAMSLSE